MVRIRLLCGRWRRLGNRPGRQRRDRAERGARERAGAVLDLRLDRAERVGEPVGLVAVDLRDDPVTGVLRRHDRHSGGHRGLVVDEPAGVPDDEVASFTRYRESVEGIRVDAELRGHHDASAEPPASQRVRGVAAPGDDRAADTSLAGLAAELREAPRKAAQRHPDGRAANDQTSDGGETWHLEASGTQNWFESVAFADAQTAVAVGTNGTILRTEDGGLTWSPIFVQSGGVGGWEFRTDALPTTATSIGFHFVSDGSITMEGVYLDEVMVAGRAPDLTCEASVGPAVGTEGVTSFAFTGNAAGGVPPFGWSWDFDVSGQPVKVFVGQESVRELDTPLDDEEHKHGLGSARDSADPARSAEVPGVASVGEQDLLRRPHLAPELLQL